MEEIIYFEINDWFSNYDYPNEEPFLTWMKEPTYFSNEEWVKENKLVVVACFVDMAFNACVSAPKTWVEKYCPNLLTKHKRFLCFPEENKSIVEGAFADFLPYTEENIGIHFVEDPY